MTTIDLAPGAEQIIAATATFFTLSTEDIRGRRKASELAYGRQIAMYLCRELTDLSLLQIGEAFGGRNHTTVLHAERKVRAALDDHPTIRAQLDELTALITSSRSPAADTHADPTSDRRVRRDTPRRRKAAAPPPLNNTALRQAQLVVAGAAQGSDDCRELLDMLGLLRHVPTRRQRGAAQPAPLNEPTGGDQP